MKSTSACRAFRHRIGAIKATAQSNPDYSLLSWNHAAATCNHAIRALWTGMRFARNGMDVRIAGIHMAVFRQAGRIAYGHAVANAHEIVGDYYYDFMVSWAAVRMRIE